MNVLVDTNILISAALRNRDPEFVIQFILNSSEFEWIVTPEIVVEYREVLGREKFRLNQTIKRQWFDLFDTLTCIDVTISVDFPADPNDAMFLACAIATDADFLITGDSALLQTQSIANTAIVTVNRFKTLFCNG